MSQTGLVVGGGQAGGQAVARLRLKRNEFDGRIVRVGAESVLP